MKWHQNDPFADVNLSDDAIKLANVLYNTYVQEHYPYLEISVVRLCEVFGYSAYPVSKEAIEYLQEVFDELNEPVLVTNFKFGSRIHDWKVIQFCEFDHPWEEEDEYIEVTINEMFIAAMKEYMSTPFINIR